MTARRNSSPKKRHYRNRTGYRLNRGHRWTRTGPPYDRQAAAAAAKLFAQANPPQPRKPKPVDPRAVSSAATGAATYIKSRIQTDVVAEAERRAAELTPEALDLAGTRIAAARLGFENAATINQGDYDVLFDDLAEELKWAAARDGFYFGENESWSADMALTYERWGANHLAARMNDPHAYSDFDDPERSEFISRAQENHPYELWLDEDGEIRLFSSDVARDLATQLRDERIAEREAEAEAGRWSKPSVEAPKRPGLFSRLRGGQR